MSAGMGIIQEYPTQTSGIPLGAPFPIPPHPGAPQAPAWMWNSTKKWNLGLPCSRLPRKSRIWKLGDLVAARKTAGAEHGKGSWQESRALGSQPMEFKERFPCLDPMFDG